MIWERLLTESGTPPGPHTPTGATRLRAALGRAFGPRFLLPMLLREGCSGTYRRVLSTSFGFGGLNAAVVLGAPDG